MDKLQAQIEDLLIDIISAGVNRSLCALVNAEAIDSSVIQEHYIGIGSEYYALVSKEIEYTAKHGAKAVKDKLEKN